MSGFGLLGCGSQMSSALERRRTPGTWLLVLVLVLIVAESLWDYPWERDLGV